jgi:hypothetical protein
VWGDTFVEEGNLTQYISHLRKALGDSEDIRLIVTIARKGYQFTGNVTVAEATDPAKHAAVEVSPTESSRADTQPVPQIMRFRKCRSIGEGCGSGCVCRHFGGGLRGLAALSGSSAARAQQDHACRTAV